MLSTSRDYISIYLYFYLKEKKKVVQLNKEDWIGSICMDSVKQGGQVQWKRRTKKVTV